MRFISDDIAALVGYPADDFTGAAQHRRCRPSLGRTATTLDERGRREMGRSRRLLDRALDDAEPIYGLTTGVGPQNGLNVDCGEQAQAPPDNLEALVDYLQTR
jgi:hypothetical protein